MICVFFLLSDFINLNDEAIKIQQKVGKNFVLPLLKLVYEVKQEAKIAKFTYKSTILYEELREKI